MILRVSGWEGYNNSGAQLMVYLSTSSKYPEEKDCQSLYKNPDKIEFSLQGKTKGTVGEVKFTKPSLFICFESSINS